MIQSFENQKFRAKFLKKLLLQKSPETFLEAVRNYLEFVEGAPTSGLYNAPTLMTTRPPQSFFIETNVSFKVSLKNQLEISDFQSLKTPIFRETDFQRSNRFFIF